MLQKRNASKVSWKVSKSSKRREKNQEHGREEYKNLPEDEKMLVEYGNKI